jgi:hypothetical protein
LLIVLHRERFQKISIPHYNVVPYKVFMMERTLGVAASVLKHIQKLALANLQNIHQITTYSDISIPFFAVAPPKLLVTVQSETEGRSRRQPAHNSQLRGIDGGTPPTTPRTVRAAGDAAHAVHISPPLNPQHLLLRCARNSASAREKPWLRPEGEA